MQLANDISRCTNDSCPLRNDCERWKQRDSGRVKTLYWHKYHWSQLSIFIAVCDYQIKPFSQDSEG